MALGTLGSTLNDELNRLANGGTYRNMDQMVDEALAAKQWANRENINPYSTDTVGILNEIAGLGLDKRNWLDFNGVCNYIAGTTGLPAAAALRQVYPTTDLLTGVASYYVDANNFNTPGYVYLSGTSGNFMSVPDSSLLDITGDIDIRARLALANWASGAEQRVISKWASGGQGSYVFSVLGNGTLLLSWYPDGVVAASATSTASVSFNPNQTGWVRVTLDVSDGSGNNVATFFTSTDGVTWTTLGTPITQAFITSIFSGTANLGIGSSSSGLAALATGKFYQVQILNGINGTNALNANMANVPFSATSFTDSTNQTVTINGVRLTAQDADNLGAAGSLLPTTLGSSTAADSNDPKFLDFTGTNYVYLPGVASNYLSIPNAAPLQITGDIDLRVQVALDNWAPSSDNGLIWKWSSPTTRSYGLTVSPTGILTFYWTTDGSTIKTSSCTTATGLSAGAIKWVRATMDVDNGASGNDVKFYLSDNGTTWTQLGSTVTTAGTTSIYNSTSIVELGSLNTGATYNLSGKVYRAQIFNGIDGTKVLDVDTSVITAGSATSFTAVTGQTVTINRGTSGRKTVAVTQPTWLFGTDDYMEVNNRYMSSGTYLYLPGVAGNWATAPDSAALDITGDIDIRAKVALDDWTPAAITGIMAKDDAGALAYYIRLNTNGTLTFQWVTAATATLEGTSTVPVGAADGTTKWIRATLDVDNGAGGYDLKFWTSDDGVTWTQLGTTTTGGTTTDIRATLAQFSIGNRRTSTDLFRGKFFRAQVLNGINGTVAFDANFETSITSLNQASFTESSANAATVTINRSGSAFRSAGITTAGYLYPGATNTFAASATDFLNFGASDNLTALVLFRNFATPASSSFGLLGNQTSAGGVSGWQLRNSGTTTAARLDVQSGATSLNTTAQSYTLGSITPFFGIFNRATNTIQTYVGTTASATVAASTVGNITSYLPVRIGAWNGTLLSYDGEIYAAAVFRTALTATQIRQISNYFANREVYL